MKKILTILFLFVCLSANAANPYYDTFSLSNNFPLIGLGGGKLAATNPAAFLNLVGASSSINTPTLNGTNFYTGTNNFSGVTIATNPASIFSGNGANLNNLPASALSYNPDVAKYQGSSSLAVVVGGIALAMAGSDTSAGTFAQTHAPRTTLFSNLWLRVDTTILAGTNIVMALRTNGVVTSLSVTMTGGNTSVSNLTTGVTVAAGTSIDWWFLAAGGATNATISPNLSWTER